MEHIYNKTAILIILSAILTLMPVLTYGYSLLAPLPGYAPPAAGQSLISAYFSALFRFAIVAASILAVIVIIIAGLKYVGAAGNPAVINDAKDQIFWAILGLILALSSWMILNIINPELLELKLEIKPTKDIQSAESLFTDNTPGCNSGFCWLATESACTNFNGKKVDDASCTATKPAYATLCCGTDATYVCSFKRQHLSGVLTQNFTHNPCADGTDECTIAKLNTSFGNPAPEMAVTKIVSCE
ncbi:MAG: hypothetical protein AAB378_03125 [Patescibacteria group bacterium]